MHLDLGKMRICQSWRCRSVGNKALGQCRSRSPSPLSKHQRFVVGQGLQDPTLWAVCSAGDSGDGPHGLGSEGTSTPSRSWARAAPQAPTPPRHCTSPVLPFPVGGVSIGCRCSIPGPTSRPVAAPGTVPLLRAVPARVAPGSRAVPGDDSAGDNHQPRL